MPRKKPSTRSEESKAKADWLSPYHFKKGAPSPNPSGRPKKRPITDSYEEALEHLVPEEVRLRLGLGPGAKMRDAIARGMVIRAVSSQKAVEAAREIREAIEGKAATAMTVKHSGGVRIRVVYKRGKPGGLGSDDFESDAAGN